MKILRIAVLLLALASFWRCRQATMPETDPDRPGPAGEIPLVPGSSLHRPEIGSAFRPDSALPMLPRPFPLEGGGGSQTETLTGMVLSSMEAPQPGIRVKLVPSGYDPSSPDSAAVRAGVTDDSGRIVFAGLDTSGYYNLIAGEPGQPTWAFAESLQTRPGPHRLPLRPTSAFFIQIRRDDGAYATSDSGIAFFRGTDILVHCEGSAARLDTIPQVPYGLERLIVRSRAGWEREVLVPADSDKVQITAKPGSATLFYLPK